MINSVDVAIEQLIKDKDTVLEGYVSEYLFEKQFLDGANKEYTHSIWTAKWRQLRLLFVFKQDPSNFDKKLLSDARLKTIFSCWHVYYKDCQLYFSNGNVTYEKQLFLERIGNVRFPKEVQKAHDGLTKRKKKCIDFFKNQNYMLPIARERDFVNNFLAVYFTSIVNIDYVSLSEKGELMLYEVKFKNENYEGYFGINVGQWDLLNILSVCGFKIFYAVLYKDRLHSSLHIFDYIYASNISKKWYIAELDLYNYVKCSNAPAYTSVYGNKQQRVYYYEKKEVLDKGEGCELIIP